MGLKVVLAARLECDTAVGGEAVMKSKQPIPSFQLAPEQWPCGAAQECPPQSH